MYTAIMIKVVKGNKLIETNPSTLLSTVTANYSTVEVDFGTGDGRFVYKSAVRNPHIFYIGIDPNQKQLEIYSKKAQKEKLQNAAFILDSIEKLDWDTTPIAQKIYVILPWGSLLQAFVGPNLQSLQKLKNLLKPNGQITIILGYSPESEPNETQRLQLQYLTSEYIETVLKTAYAKIGLTIHAVKKLQKTDLKEFETTWSKKLVFGKDRTIFLLEISTEPCQNNRAQ